MQDFAAELRAARDPLSPDWKSPAPRGGFEAYLVQTAVRQGFELGYGAGENAGLNRVDVVREEARRAGFDAGVRVLLVQVLTGLQEVVGELESRRAAKVMLERARGKLDELVGALDGVQGVLAPVSGQQSFEGLGVIANDMLHG